jgi:hypothetical protein
MTADSLTRPSPSAAATSKGWWPEAEPGGQQGPQPHLSGQFFCTPKAAQPTREAGTPQRKKHRRWLAETPQRKHCRWLATLQFSARSDCGGEQSRRGIVGMPKAKSHPVARATRPCVGVTGLRPRRCETGAADDQDSGIRNEQLPDRLSYSAKSATIQ